MRDFETAMDIVQRKADERFPKGECTIKTLQWCDGDFEITAQWGFGQTEEDNTLREEIVVTPHSMERQVVEITESERGTTHQREELE